MEKLINDMIYKTALELLPPDNDLCVYNEYQKVQKIHFLCKGEC